MTAIGAMPYDEVGDARVTKWEYRVCRVADLSGGALNAFGDQGWELVTVTPSGKSVFKRPKVGSTVAWEQR